MVLDVFWSGSSFGGYKGLGPFHCPGEIRLLQQALVGDAAAFFLP